MDPSQNNGCGSSSPVVLSNMVDVPIRTDNFKFSDPRYRKVPFARGKTDTKTYVNGKVYPPDGSYFPFTPPYQTTIDAKIGLGSRYRLPFTVAVDQLFLCKKADGTLSIESKKNPAKAALSTFT